MDVADGRYSLMTVSATNLFNPKPLIYIDSKNFADVADGVDALFDGTIDSYSLVTFI